MGFSFANSGMVTVHKVCVEMNSYTVYKVFSGLMFSTKNDSYLKIDLFDTPKAKGKVRLYLI